MINTSTIPYPLMLLSYLSVRELFVNCFDALPKDLQCTRLIVDCILSMMFKSFKDVIDLFRFTKLGSK